MHDYLTWNSSITLSDVFETGESFSYPHVFENYCLYLTSIKHEGSRNALMMRPIIGGETATLTPNKFNLGSKVSEYGGRPFWLIENKIYFCNQSDQCLYEQTLSSQGATEPKRVTVKPSDDRVFMYTDVHSLSATTLIAIIEVEEGSKPHNDNSTAIALISLTDPEQPPKVLVEGADFYSNLVVSREFNRLAWLEWSHPNMPWDDNVVYQANIELNQGAECPIRLTQKTPVDFGATASACQLFYANNGSLFLSVDFAKQADSYKNYWNIYCVKGIGAAPLSVTKLNMEFGYPHWQYGDTRIVQYNEKKLLAIGSSPKGDNVLEIDQDSLISDFLDWDATTVQHLYADGRGRGLCVHLPKDQPPVLVELQGDLLKRTALMQGGEFKHSPSVAETIEFTSSQGQAAHGFYYPPLNEHYQSDLAPPLIVLVHGGPTARAYRHFDIQKQFWTSHGFALFDVNHHGSSGYGRAYRDSLYGRWGEADTLDIIDGINFLVQQGKADSNKVCIRGKSAGGYAVLRALTEYPDVFCAGASYYGIGNLATLAEATHKFEKHYTDRLIGEKYDAKLSSSKDSRFYQRSPIHKIDQIKCAMIVYQGLKDKVVPPSVAKEIVDALKDADLEHEYIEYPDEAHGFRQVENNIDALGRELAFYRQVLSKVV